MTKTALELTREEWKAYRIPPRVETPELKKRKEEAWQVARQAAQILHQQFGAKEVIVFGSLARGYDFNEWSDIDLAVELIDSDLFYRAVAAVTAFSPDFGFDVVDLAICPARLFDEIKNEGKNL